MVSPNIRDILTSFSPSFDFCAIASGDGRVKIWDALKGQVQTEFADITSTDGMDMQSKSPNGHLSVDYTCMKWVPLQAKKKKRSTGSLLVLGTGSGDLLALDVSMGQLRWRINDCHPGGVSAISFSKFGSSVYSGGADGMVCQIDGMKGLLLRKFKASANAVSSISVSFDGKLLATAGAQLKVFNCSDFEKIQKFSGHPASVRCMIFTDDGKYVLSTAVGERYVAVWRVDGGKKQHSSCVLSMDHPGISLDAKKINAGGPNDEGLLVLAISEMGACYIWSGRNIEELQKSKATKISLAFEGPRPNGGRVSMPTIFTGRLQDSLEPSTGVVLVGYGSLVKPVFERLHVQHGVDVKLNWSPERILLPKVQSAYNRRNKLSQKEVIALDRANAEDAILPLPKLYGFHDKKRKHDMQYLGTNVDEVMVQVGSPVKGNHTIVTIEDQQENVETESMEHRLRKLGILDCEEDADREKHPRMLNDNTPNSTTVADAQSLIEANLPPKKMRATVASMSGNDACKLLQSLVAIWKSRHGRGKEVLLWISVILLKHAAHIISKESLMLNTLIEMTRSRGDALQPLLQLSGRLQLITTQIGKAGQNVVRETSQMDEDEDGDVHEDEDEEIDELAYGEEEEDISE